MPGLMSLAQRQPELSPMSPMGAVNSAPAPSPYAPGMQQAAATSSGPGTGGAATAQGVQQTLTQAQPPAPAQTPAGGQGAPVPGSGWQPNAQGRLVYPAGQGPVSGRAPAAQKTSGVRPGFGGLLPGGVPLVSASGAARGLEGVITGLRGPGMVAGRAGSGLFWQFGKAADRPSPKPSAPPAPHVPIKVPAAPKAPSPRSKAAAEGFVAACQERGMNEVEIAVALELACSLDEKVAADLRSAAEIFRTSGKFKEAGLLDLLRGGARGAAKVAPKAAPIVDDAAHAATRVMPKAAPKVVQPIPRSVPRPGATPHMVNPKPAPKAAPQPAMDIPGENFPNPNPPAVRRPPAAGGGGGAAPPPPPGGSPPPLGPGMPGSHPVSGSPEFGGKVMGTAKEVARRGFNSAMGTVGGAGAGAVADYVNEDMLGNDPRNFMMWGAGLGGGRGLLRGKGPSLAQRAMGKMPAPVKAVMEGGASGAKGLAGAVGGAGLAIPIYDRMAGDELHRALTNAGVPEAYLPKGGLFDWSRELQNPENPVRRMVTSTKEGLSSLQRIGQNETLVTGMATVTGQDPKEIQGAIAGATQVQDPELQARSIETLNKSLATAEQATKGGFLPLVFRSLGLQDNPIAQGIMNMGTPQKLGLLLSGGMLIMGLLSLIMQGGNMWGGLMAGGGLLAGAGLLNGGISGWPQIAPQVKKVWGDLTGGGAQPQPRKYDEILGWGTPGGMVGPPLPPGYDAPLPPTPAPAG